MNKDPVISSLHHYLHITKSSQVRWLIVLTLPQSSNTVVELSGLASVLVMIGTNGQFLGIKSHKHRLESDLNPPGGVLQCSVLTTVLKEDPNQDYWNQDSIKR